MGTDRSAFAVGVASPSPASGFVGATLPQGRRAVRGAWARFRGDEGCRCRCCGVVFVRARRSGLAATYSPAPFGAVPSALGVFTSEFGMGSGGGPPPWPPGRSGARVLGFALARVFGFALSRVALRLGAMGTGVCRRARLDRAFRTISTGRLRALPRFDLRPIDVVVFHGSRARPRFEGGFPLRCLQRLSLPRLATLLRRWRDDRSTGGASIPVLSYWGRLLPGLEHPRQIGTELSHDVLNPAHVPL